MQMVMSFTGVVRGPFDGKVCFLLPFRRRLINTQGPGVAKSRAVVLGARQSDGPCTFQQCVNYSDTELAAVDVCSAARGGFQSFLIVGHGGFLGSTITR